MKKNKRAVFPIVLANILAVIAIASLFLSSCSCSNINGNGIVEGTDASGTAFAESVGIEAYDLSLYEESSEEYYAALNQMEDDWFPRSAVVIPKGPEGGN